MVRLIDVAPVGLQSPTRWARDRSGYLVNVRERVSAEPTSIEPRREASLGRSLDVGFGAEDEGGWLMAAGPSRSEGEPMRPCEGGPSTSSRGGGRATT